MMSRNTRTTTTDKTAITSHTNYRYLLTPEKHARLARFHRENRAIRMKLTRLRLQLSKAIAEKGVELDSSMTEDLQQVIKEEEEQALKSVDAGSFQHIFWEEQKKATACKDRRGMRWHPAMIKWCIFLRHQSSKAYETIRQSGCVHLPSQRTLQDYTHCVKSSAGFSVGVDRQLLQAANLATCQPFEKLVCILLDEMYIRENLVYTKSTGKLVGYTAFGDINDHLLAFEKSLSEKRNQDEEIAKTMLVIMVRGLFSKLRFPYAQFPCLAVTGELLFTPFWKAVFRLERLELKVWYKLTTVTFILVVRYWLQPLMAPP